MRLPKHTTVVAYLALFVAMSGTAYAVTGGNFVLGHDNRADRTTSLTNPGSGAALRLATRRTSTPPLAVSNSAKIAKLNADELDGLSSGAFQRKVSRIFADVSTTSTRTVAAGTVGPWSFSLKCRKLSGDSGGSATFKITGPGTAGGTNTRSNQAQPGNTFVNPIVPIGDAGYVTIADTNQQESATFFLHSGPATAEVEILQTVIDGSPQNCNLIGAATLISS
jgi:hypothetical protein